MEKAKLSQLTKKAPKNSGIYIFKNKGHFLYVGKATNINNRLRNYVKPHDSRIRKMVEMATSLSFKTTGSDIEALILESQYIKKHRPKFNIVLRDDKQYFFVNFSNDIFPRIFLSHQVNGSVGPKGPIGPFTDGTALKLTLKHLRKIFPYCTCKQKHNNFCLNYHIDNCLGFCCLKKEPEIYQIKKYHRNIEAIRDILLGKKNILIKKLKERMIGLGKKEKFTEAIAIRDQIEKVERVFKNISIIKNMSSDSMANNIFMPLGIRKAVNRIEGYDISNIQGTNATGSMVAFIDNKPNRNQYRKFRIRTVKKSDDIAMLREVLERRFAHKEWPILNLVIIDGGKAQYNVARRIIPRPIPIIALTKNKKHLGSHIYTPSKSGPINLSELPAPLRNLILGVDSEAHRLAITYYRKLHRKKTV